MPDPHGDRKTLTRRAEQLRDRATGAAHEARRRWPLLELPVELFRRWIRVNASVLAGHLAFRIFLFIIPLLLVLVSALGLASSSGVDVGEQGEQMRMGQALARSLADASSDAERGATPVAIIGLVALLSAASGLVSALRLVVATSWEIPVKGAPRSKVKTMGWLVPGVILILLGVGVRQWLSRRGLVLEGFGALVGISLNTLTLLGLFWILPRRCRRLVELVPGAITLAAGFTGLNIAGAVYFTGKLQQSSQVYGALGVAVTVLVYLFFLGQIVVLATLVNAVWYDRASILDQQDGDRRRADPPESGDGSAGPALS